MKSLNKELAGHFKMPDGRKVFGLLDIRAKQSALSLFDDDHFDENPDNYETITGELSDGRSVTLINCILISCSRNFFKKTQKPKNTATIFPHHVIVGKSKLPPLDECISSFSFSLPELNQIFDDPNVFTDIMYSESWSPLLKQYHPPAREKSFGENPLIYVFSGQFDIFELETQIGTIKAHRTLKQSMGNLELKLKAPVILTIIPDSKINFSELLRRLHKITRFLDLILGGEHPLHLLQLKLDEDSHDENFIYRSYALQKTDKEADNHCFESLISAHWTESQFTKVLASYLDLDAKRSDSRIRYNQTFNTSSYTIDRLIAAANIFDILPSSVIPSKIDLSPELKDAKKQAREIFKPLPMSLERDSLLNAIGRLGTRTLKQKIRYRINETKIDAYFPSITDVLDEAVNCRNHFVHGTESKVDYLSNSQVFIFLTNTLEFAFGVSDLIDCGWDLNKWLHTPQGRNHRFRKYVENYSIDLVSFHGLCKKEKESGSSAESVGKK